MIRPPRRGPLFAVTSYRLRGGRREMVSRLFRFRSAADNYADHQRYLDREPVTVWTVDLPAWQEAGSSW